MAEFVDYMVDPYVHPVAVGTHVVFSQIVMTQYDRDPHVSLHPLASPV